MKARREASQDVSGSDPPQSQLVESTAGSAGVLAAGAVCDGRDETPDVASLAALLLLLAEAATVSRPDSFKAESVVIWRLSVS